MAKNTKSKGEEVKGCLPEVLSHQCGDSTYYCCLCPPKSRISFGIWENMQAYVACLFGSAILASSLTQTRNTELYKIGNYIKYVNIPIACLLCLFSIPVVLRRAEVELTRDYSKVTSRRSTISFGS